MARKQTSLGEGLAIFGCGLRAQTKSDAVKMRFSEDPPDPGAWSKAMNGSRSRIHGPCPAQMSCHWIVFGPRTCPRPKASKSNEQSKRQLFHAASFLLFLIFLWRMKEVGAEFWFDFGHGSFRLSTFHYYENFVRVIIIIISILLQRGLWHWRDESRIAWSVIEINKWKLH